jgi:hypothetical protein
VRRHKAQWIHSTELISTTLIYTCSKQGNRENATIQADSLGCPSGAKLLIRSRCTTLDVVAKLVRITSLGSRRG